MKLNLAILLTCLILFPASEIKTEEPEPSNQTVCVSNINVVDVENKKVIDDQTIIIKDGKIEFVGPGKDQPKLDPDVVIDGNGQFAIPGLWDMHIHAYSPQDMALFPINGVVGVRLMWGMPMHNGWRNQFESGEKLGPRMMIASTIIDGPNPIWPGSIVASDKESGIEAVEKAIAGKADFAKVYSLLPSDAYFAIAKTCKQKGLPFDGHVPMMVSVAEASNAGQRSMEHMYEVLVACSSKSEELGRMRAEFVESKDGKIRSLFGDEGPAILRRALETYDEEVASELFATLRKNQTWQCPTLTVLRNLAYLTEPEIQNNPNLKYINKGLRNFIAPKAPRKKQSAREIQVDRKRFQKHLQVLGQMHSAGVPIIAGTDVLNPFCLPGFSLHTELELMVKAGLSPADALQTATINAARFQNQTQTMGSIAVGKLADVVLLSANPLDEITNTRKIETVICRGKVMDREKRDALLKAFEN